MESTIDHSLPLYKISVRLFLHSIWTIRSLHDTSCSLKKPTYKPSQLFAMDTNIPKTRRELLATMMMTPTTKSPSWMPVISSPKQ
ncbi:hypothetical protein TNCT_657171 [Trichonephila clavata]|uniref:Uncharacterized protein n=1 Tax=Trichonephila clavata TaxID=2740835 RepID=A0A8X6LPF2_TRICU|nr:hypothetical protein TNCT_657171 [Trichonephila clavata]